MVKKMKKKTILIAETHKEQAEFIKNALIRNNIEIEVLNIEPNNSEDMKEAIIDLEPDIVFTNEKKSDKPATDVIKEIQGDIRKKQPIFIISSAFSEDDIELLCRKKGICAYLSSKPSDANILAKVIGKIANGEEVTELHKYLYYNFSKENLDIVSQFMINNASSYAFNSTYKEISNELSELHKDLLKAPRRVREKIKRFEYLQNMNNMYENAFIYQYFNNKLNN